MSALARTADSSRASRDFRLVPISDIVHHPRDAGGGHSGNVALGVDHCTLTLCLVCFQLTRIPIFRLRDLGSSVWQRQSGVQEDPTGCALLMGSRAQFTAANSVSLAALVDLAKALGKVEYCSKRFVYPNTCSQRCSASDNPRPRLRT